MVNYRNKPLLRHAKRSIVMMAQAFLDYPMLSIIIYAKSESALESPPYLLKPY